MATSTADTALVWFRQDLRLADNPALHHAISAHQAIVAVFVLDDETPGMWRTGAASRWWLHHALESLMQSLQQHGVELVLRRGRWEDCIPELAAKAGASAVYAGQMVEPWAAKADADIARILRRNDIAFQLYRSATLYDLDSIRSKAGTHYEVYGAFRRSLMQRTPPAHPLPAPRSITAGPSLASDKLAHWGLLPTKPDWAGGFRDQWQPGEDVAHHRLREFLKHDIDAYPVARDIPAESGTSQLSPYLQWGEISPAQIWHAADHTNVNAAAAQTYKNEIIWREFAAYLLYHRSEMPEQPLQEKYKKLGWRRSKADLESWQSGRTGIPIVDAGMRQLWHCGWMHNRVRMIVGSFLVKHLLLPWRVGEEWFWDTLVDANLASNAMNWQWVAGTGADPQPFFRIFNPILQGQKFDPDGEYVRRFVPELAGLPIPFLHTPWEAPAHVLEKANVVLDGNYPNPVVDLAFGRQRALSALKEINVSSKATLPA